MWVSYSAFPESQGFSSSAAIGLFHLLVNILCIISLRLHRTLCSSVQLLSHVRLFVTPRTFQASLSITNSQSLLKFMSIESVIPSNHLILCRPLLHLPSVFFLYFLPSIFPSIRVFSNESTLRIRWPKYWSFSFNISPSNEYSGLISFRMDWLDLLAVQGTLKSLLQHHSSKASILQHSAFFIVQLTPIHDHWKNHSFDSASICLERSPFQRIITGMEFIFKVREKTGGKDRILCLWDHTLVSSLGCLVSCERATG